MEKTAAAIMLERLYTLAGVQDLPELCGKHFAILDAKGNYLFVSIIATVLRLSDNGVRLETAAGDALDILIVEDKDPSWRLVLQPRMYSTHPLSAEMRTDKRAVQIGGRIIFNRHGMQSVLHYAQ